MTLRCGAGYASGKNLQTTAAKYVLEKYKNGYIRMVETRTKEEYLDKFS